VGRGSRPDRRRSWYSTFAPYLDTRPRNQPALGQTYATVVFVEGRVSGEQMLTVGRGLWTAQQISGGRFWPQAWPPLSAVSHNCLGTQHSALWPRRRVVLQRQTQIVCRYSTPPAQHNERHVVTAIRSHSSQGRARSARYKDGSSGGAASLLLRRAVGTRPIVWLPVLVKYSFLHCIKYSIRNRLQNI